MRQTEPSVAVETPVLALSGVDKTFPGVKALSDVSLQLFAGEVTALIGENGAGKSTVVKTLTGIYQPDAGDILIHGKKVEFSDAKAASAYGITAIYQETVLFDELSVAENIFIGHAPRGFGGLIDTRKMYQNAAQILASIDAPLDPKQKLSELGIAKKHLVAIARALSIDAQVVIFDEPTAALSHKEVEELYELIEKLKAQGKAILFISHKFDEIFRIADRYTVFRDGAFIGEGHIKDTSEKALVKMMVGRDLEQIYPVRHANIGEEVFRVEGFSHPTEFDDISFSLRAGEILGVYGLVGAGRSEVMQSIFGVTKSSHGQIYLDGKPLHIKKPNDAIRAGIAYVPEDRGKQGGMTSMPIYQNVTLPSLAAVSKAAIINTDAEFDLTRKYTERLDLRAPSLDTNLGTLSGGNQQKVVVAKWLATNPKVIILDEPTKGIDVGSKAAVHEFMAELAAQGLAVIMVSSEIPEILGMSDRVVVMREGRIVEIVTGEGLTPENLVRKAADIAEVK